MQIGIIELGWIGLTSPFALLHGQEAIVYDRERHAVAAPARQEAAPAAGLIELVRIASSGSLARSG
jgi:6-phosphogluconate dehydrogenase (decarboxylating)